ncbi:MAG TPA: hypothetical protein PKK67_06575, partial [Cyclobacteriaceae bacterium]|nr:hypothetical protein [Cyclobacteriaceae bacterium]
IAVNEVVALIRKYENEERLLIIHNISDGEVTLKPEGQLAAYSKIEFVSQGEVKMDKNGLVLPAYTSVILK